MTDEDGVHGVRYGHLPRVVLTHSLRRTTLAKRHALRVLAADDLPAERPKGFSDRIGM